jgi:hypothetical protein
LDLVGLKKQTNNFGNLWFTSVVQIQTMFASQFTFNGKIQLAKIEEDDNDGYLTVLRYFGFTILSTKCQAIL